MGEYWNEQIARLGKNALFVDTGAIIGVFERGVSRFSDFFSDEANSFRFVTSTYVVAESVRRLVKSNTHERFIGPGGEKTATLALHILRAWLDEHNFTVLCIPEDVFNEAKRLYRTYCGIHCDLTDVISLAIVQGLDKTEIVAADGHFKSFGLRCLP
jgi:predicted nucleic acid-binding protein